ncbi:hypothetical protein AX15_005348 [Amanita polypyramis BW_CC]|nr:hypothetical protein AX15_005348 [Amanita polypyramis BW_CC]
MVLPIEKALVRNAWPTSILVPDKSSPESMRLAYDVINGRFGDVLASPPAKELFQIQSWDGPLEEVFNALKKPTEGEEDELVRLVIAIALLHAFIQANWTGLDLDFRSSDLFQSSQSPPSEEKFNAKAIAELAYGGEPAYHLEKYPIYLRLAQIILLPSSPKEGETTNLRRLKTAPWWVLRLTLLHQQILDEPVPPPDVFSSALSSSVEFAISTFTPESSLTQPGPDADLSARLLLTYGHLFHLLSQDKQAASLFSRAVRATGFQHELTGALGKRTKFQQEDLSQLVILAESRLKVDSTASLESNATDNATGANGTNGAAEEKPRIAQSLALNDDTLLETTQYSSVSSSLSHVDPSSQPTLHPLDQAILLSLAQTLSATSPSSDPLTSSQLSAYISRVLLHPENWSIHTMALLSRSRLEGSRTRTVERAVLQIQALVDQMPATDEEGKADRGKAANIREWLEYFWEILLPSRWALEKELADKFVSLGVVKSALEIYERLEIWEQVVKCYATLEKPEKGIEIVRDLLEGRRREADVVVMDGKTTISRERRISLDRAREAKLLCILGDLEPVNAVEYYARAWDVSAQTSSRAMRSLGGLYFSQGKYDEAIECLRKAVKINPLVARAWFVLGCACMRAEDWDGAREAFARCVKIDEEDAESWSNLAGVYLRMPTSASTSSGSDANDDEIADSQLLNQKAEQIPIEHKLLAYRALKQGLKFSYNNWKMWYNYMIVCVDVGELFEAARALGRVVEQTSGQPTATSDSNEGEETVLDLDVVDRLVDAVAKGSAGSPETIVSSTDEQPNESGSIRREPTGLSRTVTTLFEGTLLPRVSSSPRLFRAYARLMTLQGRWDDALKAYLDAYRAGAAGTWGSSPSQAQEGPEKFEEAVREIEDIVDVLRNFGPRAEEAVGGGVGNKWRMQAKSIVRTFLARTRDEHEGEGGWDKLVKLGEELKSKSGV